MWTPVVKDEIRRILRPTPQSMPMLNCSAILESCVLDAHFTQWRTAESGAFAQDPAVNNDRISLMFEGTDQKWSVAASKKRLVTIGESVIEKRMLCFSMPSPAMPQTTKQECCVTKQLLNEIEPPVDKMELAKARLENF